MTKNDIFYFNSNSLRCCNYLVAVLLYEYIINNISNNIMVFAKQVCKYIRKIISLKHEKKQKQKYIIKI